MDLSKSAMLVSVTIVNGGLLGERKDPKASALLENTYSTARNRTKASKYLIDRKHKSVKAVVAATQRVREVVYRYTLPWGDDKSRCLPIKAHEIFTLKINEALAELEEARQEYIRAYPLLVNDSKHQLGKLFDPAQYPEPQRLADMFVSRMVLWPMPEAGHFVSEIAADAANRAKQAIQDEIANRLTQGTTDLVRRMTEVVSTFAEKLAEYDPNGNGDNKPTGIFRDSLVSNVTDIAGLVESLNLTNDPEINQRVTELRRLAAYSPEWLREDHYRRGVQISHAKRLLAKLDEMAQLDREVSDETAAALEYM